MNRKAAITKELNAKHIKILEGLLKLPENRVCADCKTIAPRWASVNIGVFICLHCSGIHRSLGVHISKVRSVTLDTWLPEQIAFLQSMGNEKSNAYWEAGLPPNFNRGGIESFIRAKYVDKRWVPRDRKINTPLIRSNIEELASPLSLRPGTGDSFRERANNRHLYKEKKGFSTTEKKEEVELSGGGSPMVDKGHDDHEKRHHHQEIKEKHQPSVDATASDITKSVNHESPTEPAKVAPNPTPNDNSQKSVVSKVQSSASNLTASPKVDYATELFRMLCTDDSSENDSSSSSDTNAWVDFESEEEVKVEPKSLASKVHPEPKIEDDHKASVPLTNGNSVLNSTNLNQSLPEKGSIPSVGSVHLQRISMLAQDGSPLAISKGISNGSPPNYALTIHHHVNGFQQPPLNGGNVNRIMGTQMPMQNGGIGKLGVNAASNARPSRPAVAINSISTPVKRPPGGLPVSGNDYDFSFLTQGMFSK